jgi:hypothetical protein
MDPDQPTEAGPGRKERWPPERRRAAGKASFNRGLAALGIAAAGWVLGFLIPLASSGGSNTGRMVFFPIGGFISLFMAVAAIMIGLKVRKGVGRLDQQQREKVKTFVDVDRQARYAAAGIALGIVSIVLNPLMGFMIVAIVK